MHSDCAGKATAVSQDPVHVQQHTLNYSQQFDGRMQMYSLPGDDDAQFERAVEVDADGHELGVGGEQVLHFTVLLTQQHTLETPHFKGL